MTLLAAAAVPAAAPAAERAPAPGTPPAAAPAVAPAAAPAGPAPAVAFESLNLDLGAIPEGEDAVGTFVVRNHGKADLQLLSVKPG
jgi:hypothetical protein